MNQLHKRSKARSRAAKTKGAAQIVKVQRSLTGSTGLDTVLIYNRRRSIFLEQPMTRALEAKMRGGYKCYFLASKQGTELTLKRRVANQDW